MNVLDLSGSGAGWHPQGDLAWETFRFPDGQPHIKVEATDQPVKLVCRIASSDDLITVLLAADALRRSGCPQIHLTVRYLLGARMDRPMDADGMFCQPFTLKVISDVLRTGGFASVTLIDPHSDVAAALLDATAVLPWQEVARVVIELACPPGDLVLVAPDAGASKKVEKIAETIGSPTVVQCQKRRSTATGQLSGFRIADDPHKVAGKTCLIVDDICDGGGTFAGIGEALKEAGAGEVVLYVTHGIFSKGFFIANVDRIFTTDTYRPVQDAPDHIVYLMEMGAC